MWWDSVELRRYHFYFYLNHIFCLCFYSFCAPEHESKVSAGSASAKLWLLDKNILQKSHLHMGKKIMDIVASSIIYTHDVDQTQSSILKVPWFHTPASNFPRNWHDTMGNIYEQKLAMKDSFRIFGGSFFAHPSPEILTKHNIQKLLVRTTFGSIIYTQR